MFGCVCVDVWDRGDGYCGNIVNRNTAFLVIGVLAAAVLFLSYQLYQERQQQTVDFTVSNHGISIQKH